jgi:hypothetical protein
MSLRVRPGYLHIDDGLAQENVCYNTISRPAEGKPWTCATP